MLLSIGLTAIAETFEVDGATYSTDFDRVINKPSSFMPESQDVVLVSAPQFQTGSYTTVRNLRHNSKSYTVRAIGERAFERTNFSKVTISNEIVGQNAFLNSPVEEIDASAAGYLEDFAFANCRRLNIITLPERANIGQNIFANCDKIGNVTIAKYRGSGSFYIKEIDGVLYTSYSDKLYTAFLITSDRQDITLGDGCQSIDAAVFGMGTGTLTLPQSCSSIVKGEMYNYVGSLDCKFKKVIAFCENPSYASSDTYLNGETMFEVPAGSKIAYRDNWHFPEERISGFGLGIFNKNSSSANIYLVTEDGEMEIQGDCKTFYDLTKDYTFRIEPDKFHKLVSVSLEGEDITDRITDGMFTVRAGEEGLIEFELEEVPGLYISTYTTYRDDALELFINGSPASLNEIYTGDDNFEVEIIVNPRYQLNRVTLDGRDVTSKIVDGKLLVENGSMKRLLIRLQVTDGLYLTHNEGGEVLINNSKANNGEVYKGSDFDLLILPADGHEVKSIMYGSQNYTSRLINHRLTVSNPKATTDFSVTFGEIPEPGEASLSISAPEQHTTTHIYPEGYCATVSFTPAEEWNLVSLTFNGNNVEMEEGNRFTTPALKGNNELVAIYEKKNVSGLNAVENINDVTLRVSNQTLYIENRPSDTPVEIFSIEGKKLASVYDDVIVLDEHNAVVLVKVGVRTFKAAVR